jgi:hypothetical protein
MPFRVPKVTVDLSARPAIDAPGTSSQLTPQLTQARTARPAAHRPKVPPRANLIPHHGSNSTGRYRRHPRPMMSPARSATGVRHLPVPAAFRLCPAKRPTHPQPDEVIALGTELGLLFGSQLVIPTRVVWPTWLDLSSSAPQTGVDRSHPASGPHSAVRRAGS